MVLASAVHYNAPMSRFENPCVVALLLVLGATTASALDYDPEAPERNYRVIIDRNPFGLKPPAPPPTNAPVVIPPKDEILLTGITSIGGLRAYFMSKPPQGKNPDYYSLGVDERKDGLEVLAIDTSKKSVRVRNAGVEAVMTFAANGVKPPPSAVVQTGGNAAAPGANPQIKGVPNMPGAQTVPGGNAAVGSAPALTPPGVSVTPTRSGSGRVRTVPSRNVRTPAPAMNQGVGMNQEEIRPPNPDAGVEDILLLELQKRVNPDVAFPPTPMP